MQMGASDRQIQTVKDFLYFGPELGEVYMGGDTLVTTHMHYALL